MNDHPLIWAEIDLNAIANNVRELYSVTDGYGNMPPATALSAFLEEVALVPGIDRGVAVGQTLGAAAASSALWLLIARTLAAAIDSTSPEAGAAFLVARETPLLVTSAFLAYLLATVGGSGAVLKVASAP